VLPRDAADVAAALRFAAANGLRVAPAATGHNAGPLPALDDAIVLRTTALSGVELDVAGRSVRAGAGALWREVVPPAAAGRRAARRSGGGRAVAGGGGGAGAGAVGREVGRPASAAGLAALHGSAPNVAVGGYTLGGGMGWYARAHGLACNRVTSIELVTA